ncbi:hypothetical protein L484_019871 [Morus notabilis]|uniref:Uncharacterized protein n=1 Tax=Morus notabilis TaxID=981085 RepID=W9SK96_9ROSA|nr:hypothetical protein L484_019871 [Morus notabilis]
MRVKSNTEILGRQACLKPQFFGLDRQAHKAARSSKISASGCPRKFGIAEASHRMKAPDRRPPKFFVYFPSGPNCPKPNQRLALEWARAAKTRPAAHPWASSGSGGRPENFRQAGSGVGLNFKFFQVVASGPSKIPVLVRR